VFSVRTKDHPYQKHGYGKKQDRLGFVFIQDRRLRTDGFIIRAQSTIRADGFSSAQVFEKPARYARQPCFGTDKKPSVPKHGYGEKQDRLVPFFRDRRSARSVIRPRNIATLQ
jgi:hypothetical protein